MGIKLRFLILGGNGYIGSKVVHSLITDGHEIVCTRRAHSNLKRLKDIEDKIVWVESSVDVLDSMFPAGEFDFVLNMACNYGRGSVDYDAIIEANMEFPLGILNWSVERGIKNFLTLGTGLPAEFNMYTFTKKMYENFGKFYAEKRQINFMCLKLEMFYGADEPKDRFLPSVIQRMLKGEEVYTTEGRQKRDIISVNNVVEAILIAIKSNLHGYAEIPVGTGECPSVEEIIDFIWEETGKQSAVHKGAIPMRPDEPDSVADVTAIRQLGEWNPIDWKSGIKLMIQEMKGIE